MKYLLIPLAALAVLVFLIALGAIGLAVAFALISTVGRIWRLLTGRGRRARAERDG